MLLFKPHFRGLEKEVSGLRFSNPVGLFRKGESARIRALAGLGVGFLTLTPDSDHIMDWIQHLAQQRHGQDVLLAVNLNKNIERSFSLSYDFADILIVDTNSNGGIDSPDITDIPLLLDELLNLRLCYERLTPIFLRLPRGLTPEELHSILSYCLLSGINGIVATGKSTVHQVLEFTQRRIPVIGCTSSPEEASAMLQDGASLIEMDVRPPMALKLLKTLEKEAKNHD